MNFKIMVVGGPAEQYVERCLESIMIQDYPDWHAQVVIDPVNDNTYERAKKFKCENCNIIKNHDRRYNIANFLTAAELLRPSDNDVMVMLDADDWFSDSTVLSIVNRYYEQNPELLVTHGSWQPYPGHAPNNNYPYTERDFEVGVRKSSWRGSHLRTCKYKVWKHLKDESLRDTDGYYYKVAGDLALMFPLLEMAGFSRIKFIPEILYIYNRETPYNDEKIRYGEQKDAERRIRSMEPYPLLENIPC